MVNAPATLNGHPVIQSMSHNNGYVTVMVERVNDHMPFVVATYWPELKSSWSWGHYCENEADAELEFSYVVKRNSDRNSIN